MHNFHWNCGGFLMIVHKHEIPIFFCIVHNHLMSTITTTILFSTIFFFFKESAILFFKQWSLSLSLSIDVAYLSLSSKQWAYILWWNPKSNIVNVIANFSDFFFNSKKLLCFFVILVEAHTGALIIIIVTKNETDLHNLIMIKQHNRNKTHWTQKKMKLKQRRKEKKLVLEQTI